MDAGIDYGSDQESTSPNCQVGSDENSDCVPGCGNPPEWCDPNEGLINGWCQCGFAWSCGQQNTPRPWRPEDLGVMLERHATFGDQYKGIGTYSGYNEVIVESAAWRASLPDAVEAFFAVSGGDEDFVRGAHQQFAQRYGAGKAPLVRLDPQRWDQPFQFLAE